MMIQMVLDLARRTKRLLVATLSLVTNRAPDNLPHLTRPRLLAAVVGVALAYAKARTAARSRRPAQTNSYARKAIPTPRPGSPTR